MILLQFIVYLLAVRSVPAYNSSPYYNFIVERKAGVQIGNGFSSSRDVFKKISKQQNCVTEFDAKCLQRSSTKCDYCTCKKDEIFISYQQGCQDIDDVYESFAVKNHLQFKHLNDKFPTATDLTFASGWCAKLNIPSDKRILYKNCQVTNVYKNNNINGKRYLISQSISGNIFILETKDGEPCLKCTKSDCKLERYNGHFIIVLLSCNKTNAFNLVFKKDGKFEQRSQKTTLPTSTTKTSTGTKTDDAVQPATSTATHSTVTLQTQPTLKTNNMKTKATTTTTATKTEKATTSCSDQITTITMLPHKTTGKPPPPPTTMELLETKTYEKTETNVVERKHTKIESDKSSSEMTIATIIGVVVSILLLVFIVLAVTLSKYRQRNSRRNIANMKCTFNNFSAVLHNPTSIGGTTTGGTTTGESKITEGVFVDIKDARHVSISEEKNSQPKYETMKLAHNGSNNKYCNLSDLKNYVAHEKIQNNLFYESGNYIKKENCYYYGGSKQQQSSCRDNKIDSGYTHCDPTSDSIQEENMYYGRCREIQNENPYYIELPNKSENKNVKVNKDKKTCYQNTYQQHNSDKPIVESQNLYYGTAMGYQEQDQIYQGISENLQQNNSTKENDIYAHADYEYTTNKIGAAPIKLTTGKYEYVEPVPIFNYAASPTYTSINFK